MKKYGKLLPLFLAAPLLMSCGNVKVTKPEFAEYGAEKTRSEFVAAVMDVTSNSAFEKEELLPSAVLKNKEVNKSVGEVLRGGKAISSEVTQSSAEESIQIDMENVFTLHEFKKSESTEKKDANKKDVQAISLKEKDGLQEKKGPEKTYLVEADHNVKEFSLCAEVQEGKTTKEVLDAEVRVLVDGYGYSFSSIVTSLANPMIPDEVFAKYKLYQNDKIFTVVYEDKEENEEYKVAEEVVTVTNSETSGIIQVDMTDGKRAVKMYSHMTSKVEYKKAYDGHAKDDVTTFESEGSQVATYEYSSSIKAKKADISEYVALFEVK